MPEVTFFLLEESTTTASWLLSRFAAQPHLGTLFHRKKMLCSPTFNLLLPGSHISLSLVTPLFTETSWEITYFGGLEYLKIFLSSHFMAAWQELKTCSSKSWKTQSFHLPELQPRSRLFGGPCSVDVPELLSLLHIAPNLIKQQHIALLRSPTGGKKEERTSLRAVLPRAAAGRPEWLAGSWLGAITPWRLHLTVPGSWAGSAGRSINTWSGLLLVRQPKGVTLHVTPRFTDVWHKNCIYLVAHCAFFVKVFFSFDVNHF